MGFSVQIEADRGSEVLQNLHPDGKLTGGNAVFAFLMGLLNYCSWKRDGADIYPGLEPVIEWYQQLDDTLSEPLCGLCDALMDCMWGDGGDSTTYYEDEYEFYKKRHLGVPSITEEQFRMMVREGDEHWKPIEDVLRGVQQLLNAFKSVTIKPLEGFYEPENTIPDFEALLWNLELLAKRGNEVVRLNIR